MTTKTRKIFAAVAVIVTAAAGITGATLSGESKETDLAAFCDTAAWPNIPAQCLEGSNDGPVRFVSADNHAAAKTFVLNTVEIVPTGQFVEYF